MFKVLLVIVLICKVLPAKSSWNLEDNDLYGCNLTYEYRPGLYGLCLKEPYIVHQCPECSNIEMTLDQVYIIDIDLKKQVLTTKFKYAITWFDNRIIVHDLSKFDLDIVMTSVLATQSKNEFWMPKMQIHQAIDVKSHDGLGPAETLMFDNGKMIYNKTVRFEIACLMNFQDFPFDSQTCPLEVRLIYLYCYFFFANIMHL